MLFHFLKFKKKLEDGELLFIGVFKLLDISRAKIWHETLPAVL